MEKQIIAIFAGTNGFLDDLAVERVRAFEQSLYQFLDNAHPGLLSELAEKKALDDSLRAKLKTVLGEAKTRFQAAEAARA